jgi:hypothetical protein
VAQVSGAGGGLAGIAALAKFHVDRRTAAAQSHQLEADAAEKVSSSAMMLLSPLAEELAKARAEAIALRKDVDDLRAQVALLMHVIESNGLPLPQLDKGARRERKSS